MTSTPERSSPSPEGASLTDRVVRVVDRLRPDIQSHGGELELVDVDEQNGIVRVALLGNCVGCSMSEFTVTLGLERTLKQEIPEVKEVHAI